MPVHIPFGVLLLSMLVSQLSLGWSLFVACLYGMMLLPPGVYFFHFHCDIDARVFVFLFAIGISNIVSLVLRTIKRWWLL